MNRASPFLLLLFALLGIVGCDGKAEDVKPVCVLKAAPPSAQRLRLQLTRLEVGDRDPSGHFSPVAWSTLGYDFDGLCTTQTENIGCARRANAASLVQADGDGGIDNGFARSLIPMFRVVYPMPSETWSQGASYLQVDADGRGMLYLVDPKPSPNGLTVRVPLRDARVASSDGRTGTLGAIVPLAAFTTSLREDLAPSAGGCKNTSVDSLIAAVEQAADISSSRNVDPTVPCDAISIGIAFEGTPSEIAPPAPAMCPQ